MKENMIYDTNWYQLRPFVLERMLEISKQSQGVKPGGIVFFGDSLTQFFDVERFMGHLGDVYNCGIAGITSDMLLHFIDEGVIKYQPQDVFIMIGTNDLGNTVMKSPRDIALYVKEMVEIIHYNLPICKIHVIGCLPCIEELHGYRTLHNGLRSLDTLKMIEKEYRQVIPYDYVHFISVFDSLCDHQGNVIEAYFEDGLHINEKGYIKYSEAILAQI